VSLEVENLKMKTSSTVFGNGENKSRDCKDTGAGSGACASSECNYKFATMCRATSATVLLCTHGSGIPYNHVIQLRVLMDHTVPEGSSKEKECSIIFLTSSPSCFLDDLECSFWRNNLQYLDLCFSGLSSFSHLAPWNSNLHPLHLVTLNMGWGTTSQSITLNSVSSSLCWSSLAFLFSSRIWSHYHCPGMCRCFLYISEAQYHRNYMNLIPRWPGFLALAGGANIYSQRGQKSDGKVMTDQRCSSITRQYMSNTGFCFDSVTIKNRAFFRWLRCVPWTLSILLEMQFLRYISSLQLYYTIEASTIDRQVSTDCACCENARKEFWLSIEGWRTLRWK
jgi:hypothetical protein